MDLKLHGTFAAILMSSAIAFASGSMAAPSGGTPAAGAPPAATTGVGANGTGGSNTAGSAGGTASAEYDKANPAVGALAKTLGKTSTRNAGLKGRAKARVEQKEESITRDLNRASAGGNANVSSLSTNSSATGGANIGTP
jgi:hypothetical protein